VDKNNPNPDYERFTKSMADASGGKAFVVDLDDLNGFVQALLAIFNEVQAVNSVFAAASLPISTNATGSFLNQIYFGMFRPDPAGQPRWAGNLKQYRFAVDNSDPLHPQLYLADSRPNDPVTGRPHQALSSAGTGFFSPNAVSFWTSQNTNTAPDNIDPTGALNVNGGVKGGFFIHAPQSAGEGFDLPDGEIVEKGGVSQRIRLENLINNYANTPGGSGNPRRLYTCTTGAVNCGTGSLLSATPFAHTNTDLLNHPGLLAGVAGTSISTLTRVGSTATAVLSSAMSPVLGNGQLVFIDGPTIHPRYRGQKPAGGPPTATQFTYPITVLPPATATGTGYIASTPGASRSISSAIRSGTTATITTTVAHGFVNGETIQIAGVGAGYDNGAAVVQSASTNSFVINITVGPANGSGGTATVGTTSRAISSLTLGTPAATSPFAATVTVVLSANHSFTTGQTVTITGASPNTYNGARIITGTGAAGTCPGSGANNRRFCFSINTTPTDVLSSGTASVTAASSNITSITRTASCTGGTPTPAAVATATTSAAHGFVVGETVTISGGDADNALYTGPVKVLTVPSGTTFTYDITTDTPCSDTSTGKTAAAGGADATTLINWVRGEDNLGDEAGPGAPINVRPSVHGDVLHSRPAIVNYGGSIGVVAFYGGNGGVFHAVNGNQTAAIGTVPAGGELWGFVPTEFYSKLMRQHLNAPVVKLEGTPATILPAPRPKDYFFDGSIGVYKNGATVHLYLSARRGGRIIYALDVSDPMNPRFLWKKSNADLPELGQTWSTPKVAKVKGHANPVVIFGAGYDPVEDQEPQPAANAASRSMGRGIFVLDALDGSLVWQATTGAAAGTSTCVGNPCSLDMPYPIPSDITLLDKYTADLGDYIDRLYVPDLGGNVWRVDLEPAAGAGVGFAPSTWRVSKFASVGGTSATKRKLFFPPDVVSTADFDAVMFATGDREHPTRTQQAVNILNRFYMLKDVNVGNDACPGGTCTPTIVDNTSSTACVPATLPKTATSCVEDAPTNLFNASAIFPTTLPSDFPATVGPAYDDSGNGFYVNLLNLLPHPQADGSIKYGPEIQMGEKAVNAPTTIGGNTFFGTNSPIPPAPGVCQPNLGTARGYGINFSTGQFNFAIFDGGGLPPSPVAGIVDVDGVNYPFIIGGVPPLNGNPAAGSPIGGTASSPLAGAGVEITVRAPRSRIYWYRDIGNK